MTNKEILIALYTIIRHEYCRMIRIAGQVLLAPVVTTSLYFLIFGTIIGDRIGKIHGIDYPLFIAPGLILMTIVINTYSNTSNSLYIARFQKSIEELIVSPMPNYIILIGYIVGGIIRGVIVGLLVFIVSSIFVDYHIVSYLESLGIMVAISILFSLAGFANALVARSFDDVALVPTFLLAPLTYLGGIFFDIKMLPPFWQTVSHFNPIYYMVNLLRYTMLGYSTIPNGFALFVICLTIIALIGLNIFLLDRGIGLRE